MIDEENAKAALRIAKEAKELATHALEIAKRSTAEESKGKRLTVGERM